MAHIPDHNSFYNLCSRTAWFGIINQPDFGIDPYRLSFFQRSMHHTQSSRWLAQHIGACKFGTMRMLCGGIIPTREQRRLMGIRHFQKGSIIEYLMRCPKAHFEDLRWWLIHGVSRISGKVSDPAAIRLHRELTSAFGALVYARTPEQELKARDRMLSHMRTRINYRTGELL